MRGFSFLFTILVLIKSTLGQCPWQKDVPELQTACLCAYNLGHELSVQCDQVCNCSPEHRISERTLENQLHWCGSR